MKTLKISDLDTFIGKLPPEILKDSILEYFLPNEELILHFLSETRNLNHLNNPDFNIDLDQGIINYNEKLPVEILTKRFSDFSDYIYRSYEDDHYPWETNAWENPNIQISGDDDVDYNSSYLDQFIEAFALYIKHQGPQPN